MISLTLAHHELQASAIAPSLANLNTRYIDGDAAIGRFIECVDIVGFTQRSQIDAQWRALRKKSQLQAIERGALFFESIDPLTDEPLAWVRCKPLYPRESFEKSDDGQWRSTGKIVKYETLAGEPLRASYFAVPLETWQAIADRYSVTMPDRIVMTDDGAALGFWQWVQEHPEIELVLTEGEKKALSLLSAGFAAVSVPGINCGYRCIRDSAGKVIDRRLHPDLLPFAGGGRRIPIAFDRDEKQSTREKVKSAISRTALLLSEAGASPAMAIWDGAIGKGIDDFIAAGGDIASAIASAAEPPDLTLAIARKKARNRLGQYRPDLKVCVPCLSAIAPESIPESGIVAIDAGTGTGKTKLIAKLQETTEDAIGLGHRISLQRGISERTGLTYIDDADRGGSYLLDASGRPTCKLGLCLDSLLKVPVWYYSDGSFDLILDEADQGFMHLISGATCGKDGKRPALIARAIELIRKAKRIILASATLTHREIALVCALRGGEKPWILQNTYTANRYPIELFTGKRGEKRSATKARAAVVEKYTEAIGAGKRIIAAVDERRAAKSLACIARQHGLSESQILRFDGETSSEDLQREFADRPNEFLAQHDIRLLVHSPSLTSGVSIEGDFFDLNIALFNGQTISPDDALQALARVRRPIPRVVYASHYGKSGGRIDATNAGDFARQLDRQAKLKQHAIGKTLDIDSSPIAIYHAATQADRNARMRDFGAHARAAIEAADHSLAMGDAGNPEAAIALWRAALRAVRDEDRIEILIAPAIDASEASELRQKKNLKHSEAVKLARFDICDFLQIAPDALTFEDLVWDGEGRGRRCISRLEDLLWDGLSQSKDATRLQKLTSHNAPIQAHDLPSRELESKTAIALGVRELLQFCLEAEFWHAGTPLVQEFANRVRNYAGDTKLALGFKIHDRLSNCQIVGMLLDHYKLKTQSRQLGAGKDRYRVYKLDSESRDRVRSILQKRAKLHAEQGFRLHTHPLSNLLLEGMCADRSPAPNSPSQSPDSPPQVPKPPTQ